jgi:hypothetical protein
LRQPRGAYSRSWTDPYLRVARRIGYQPNLLSTPLGLFAPRHQSTTSSLVLGSPSPFLSLVHSPHPHLRPLSLVPRQPISPVSTCRLSLLTLVLGPPVTRPRPPIRYSHLVPRSSSVAPCTPSLPSPALLITLPHSHPTSQPPFSRGHRSA